ncbi:hypothetical protein ACEWPL_006540 [Roseovarius sp. S1116L3]|uniref:hypothetical protein n=1 Tax=Roseovarius roseus TaxID=3342636 RepID=UPI00372C6F5C
MTSLEIPSLVAGGLLAAVAAIIGRLIWRGVERHLNGTADIIWTITHDVRYTPVKEIEEQFFDLWSNASKQNPSWDNFDRFTQLKNDIERSYETLAIAIINVGNAKSDTIRILLNKEPLKIAVRPDVSVHKKTTADEKVELQLDGIEPSEQFRLIFFGLSSFDVMRVVHAQSKSKQYTSDEVLPLDYIDENKRKAKSRFISVFLLLAALASISLAAYGALTQIQEDNPSGGVASDGLRPN